MKQVFAEFNHGRWIGICPRCREMGILSAVEITTGKNSFACPEEYPGLQAKMLISHPHRKGAFLSVADEDARKQAYQTAVTAGDVYQVLFPPEKAEIERVLRFRPRHAQNWYPGTTVEELMDENVRNGVKNA